jgi:DNA-binding SARP family transcriptional activator
MDVNDTNPWQDTVDLLRLMKNDFEGVRKNLKVAYETLSERENIANQRLTQALLLRGGYRTLSLVPVGSGEIVSQIGKVILGETIPYKIPKALRLDVHCFNRLEVYSGSRRLETWQNANAKSLFRLFILKLKEPIPKEVLIESLWHDCHIDTANNNLKVAIHGLRKILNRFLFQEDSFPSIVFQYGCYALNPKIELNTDVEQFEQHWMAARRFEKDGRLSDAITQFKIAEALYKGDFLGDEPYDDQTLIRRETLKDIYLIIMSRLADYSLESMDYEESIIYCQNILARDNCREDAYRRLMRCYSRLGNRSRAMRWYKICCKTIQKELDTVPEHATVELYKLLVQDIYI